MDKFCVTLLHFYRSHPKEVIVLFRKADGVTTFFFLKIFNFIFRKGAGQQDGKRKNKESREERDGGKTVETQEKIAGRVMLRGRKCYTIGNL